MGGSSEEEMESGNNSDDGVHEEGHAHSNTWDFEEGEYLVCMFGRKIAHNVSHADSTPNADFGSSQSIRYSSITGQI